MPEGVGYGPQFTASVGKELNYIGNHCYAFSGSVINGDGETDTLLEFVTSNSYMMGKFEVGFGTKANDDTRIEISINGIDVAANQYNNTYEVADTRTFKLLIPPLSNVKCQVVKVSGTTQIPVFMWIAGKVYK
jgi:ABC-type phosphate transport system substrate-binding protein